MHRVSIYCALVLVFFGAGLAAAETPLVALKPGQHTVKLKHNDRDRNFILFVPGSYDGSRDVPLVMFFHGGFGTAKHASESYGWNEKADAEGFCVAYGNGTGSIQTWNVPHCCGSSHRDNVDDVGFVQAMLDEIRAKVRIDPKRVYSTGMSNGGMLTHRLCAEVPHLIAAGAPVAGAIGGQENANAAVRRIPVPASPVPMLIVHGKEDQNVQYEGGESRSPVSTGRVDLSVADGVKFWVQANACDPAPKKEELAGGNVRVESYSGAHPVVLYTVVDGGHSWPGGKTFRRRADAPSNSLDATSVIWEFFKANPKK